MKTSPEPLLKPVIDGYSYQVDAPSDPGVWFRLVREPDRVSVDNTALSGDLRVGHFRRHAYTTL